MTEENKDNPYAVPLAIIVAGLLIAGAVFYRGQPVSTNQLAKRASSDTGIDLAKLPDLAAAVGVDKTAFGDCLASGKPVKLVTADLDNAVASGGQGTPFTVVIDTATGRKTDLPGAVSLAAVNKVIDQITAGQLSTTTAAALENIRPLSETDHWRGSRQAKIVLVEYSDIECPFCASFHPTLKQSLSTNADVAWVYRHFPLNNIHPAAEKLAEASECVAELGGNDAFWRFIDKLFELRRQALGLPI